MRTKKTNALELLSFTFFVLLFFVSSTSLALTTRTWTGATNNDFNTASNWSPSAVPSDGDSCVIIVTSDRTITVSANITIGALYLFSNGSNVNLYVDCISKVITINGNLHMKANGNSNTDLRIDVGSSTSGIIVGRHAFIDDGGTQQCFIVADLTLPGTATFKGDLTIGLHGRTLATVEPVILLDGTGSQNVIINNTDTYFLGEDLIIGYVNNPTVKLSGSGFSNGFGCYDGNVTINGTAIFDIATKKIDRIAASGGTFKIATNGTLKIGGTASFPALYGTYILVSTSNTRYYGTNQTITPLTYGNLYAETSGVKMMNAATTVSGSLFVDGSAYLDVNAECTVTGNVTVSSTAFGDFGAASAIGGNLNLTGTSTMYIDAALDINGNVNIGVGTNLYGGAVVTSVAGNWMNNGTFICENSTINFDGTGTSLVSATSSTFTSTLFTESFENGGAIPASWNSSIIVDAGTDPLITFVSASTNPTGFSATTGAYFAKFNSFSATSTGQNRLRRTTSISTVGHTNVKVSFDWTNDTGYPTANDKVTVQYSTNGTTWLSAGSDVFRYTGASNSWNNQVVTLPVGAENQATLFIAFLFTSAYGNDCYLDNVIVTGTSGTYAGETFHQFKISKTGVGTVNLGSKAFIGNSMIFNGGIVYSTTTNYPEFDEDAVASGTVNETSHVSAVVVKRTNSTVKFTAPVGNAVKYRPFSITPSGGAATVWTIEYAGTSHPDHDVDASGLTHISSQEFWNCNRTGASPVNAIIEMTWLPSTGVLDYTKLRTAQYDGTTDWNLVPSIPVGTNSSGILTSTTVISSFGSFTIGTIDLVNVLPISLTTFTGVKKETGNLLIWVTETELNNDYFTVERTTDGTHFEIVGKTEGAGTSDQVLNYTMMDYEAKETLNYYRLKQTDFDGQSSYSDLIAIDNRKKDNGKVIAYTSNLLGQEIDQDYKGIVIVVYSDGSSIKKVQ